MTPQISVYMPVFNNSPFLANAIRGVLGQTWEDLELVLLDDGSSDSSLDICHSFAARDQRIRLMAQKNLGLNGVPASNIAMRHTTGKYIARCDADDVWLPKKLEIQMKALREHDEPSACFTHAQCVDTVGHPCPPPFKGCFSGVGQGPALAHRLLCGNFLCHSTVLFHRKFIDVCGGLRTTNKLSTDHDLWLRFAAVGHLFIIEAVHCLYRIHGTNASLMYPMEANRDSYRVILDNFLAIQNKYPVDRDTLSECLRVVAYASFAAEDFLEAAYTFQMLSRHRGLMPNEMGMLQTSVAKVQGAGAPRTPWSTRLMTSGLPQRSAALA